MERMEQWSAQNDGDVDTDFFGDVDGGEMSGLDLLLSRMEAAAKRREREREREKQLRAQGQFQAWLCGRKQLWRRLRYERKEEKRKAARLEEEERRRQEQEAEVLRLQALCAIPSDPHPLSLEQVYADKPFADTIEGVSGELAKLEKREKAGELVSPYHRDCDLPRLAVAREAASFDEAAIREVVKAVSKGQYECFRMEIAGLVSRHAKVKQSLEQLRQAGSLMWDYEFWLKRSGKWTQWHADDRRRYDEGRRSRGLLP